MLTMTIDISFIHCAFSLISKFFFTKVLLALQKKKGSWQTTTCMPNLGPLTAFVNKVLLRQPHPFVCLLSVAAFELTRVGLDSCYKNQWSTKPKLFASLAVSRKTFLTLWPKHNF